MTTLLQVVILVGAVWAFAYKRTSPMVWSIGMAVILGALSIWGTLSGIWFILAWGLFAAAAVFANATQLRKEVVTKPVFELFKKMLPPMSSTEREALEAGDVWWDGELFQGDPNWKQWLDIEKPELSSEEQAFMDNQVETLCSMIDDWKITNEEKDLPKEVWEYIRNEKFFSMIIPKTYGGLEFSAVAHSAIVTKIATRSVTAAVTVMVPNSLGPAELLLHYGTNEQKQQYLPGLASGKEVPCFALTGPNAGSDAGAIPDTGVICKGMHEGKEVTGIKLNFNKRYITLAPVATVLGLAFKLYDPDHLIGETEDYGITVALIPTSHPGIQIGNRHNPLDMAFQNGPIEGKDVFIPIDWIIGGVTNAGKGWRMLVECLSAGRGISLPALSAATGQLAYRMTGAYAKVRKQFKTSIGYFEGIQEAMGRIGGMAYRLEASRISTANAIDLEVKPSVVTAIAKYHMTEMSRKILIDSMDIHAGRGVILGPRNYLGRAYQGAPISITVEGANILTRNLMIFGQGAVRCHPYVFDEMQATADEDKERGFNTFDKVLTSHIGYGVSNFAKAFALSLTDGRVSKAPITGETAHYYQQLNRMSAGLALTSDIAMLMLGGDLKRRESLSARLGDVLSHLYMSSCVLKYYQDNGQQAADLPYVQWCLEDSLYQMQEAFLEFFRNFSNKAVGFALKNVLFPYGAGFKRPSDELVQKLAINMMKDNEIRDRLTSSAYVGNTQDDPTGKMELAFKAVLKAAPVEKKIKDAMKKGVISASLPELERVDAALMAKAISKEEADIMKKGLELAQDAIHVDDFSQAYMKGEHDQCSDQPKQVA